MLLRVLYKEQLNTVSVAELLLWRLNFNLWHNINNINNIN